MSNTVVITAQDSEIEEVPRPDLEPRQHVLQLPRMQVNTTPWQYYLAFLLLAAFDIAMNAAAGSAAATVGAKLNHRPLTSKVIRIGALAGATKAGMTSFRELIMTAQVNLVFRILLIFIFSSFGICLVLTAEICNLVRENTPKELLIAAVVAAIPLMFEAVRDLEPKPEHDSETGMPDYYSRPMLSIFLLASNPLGGYVFARMASNQGMPISNYSAACSAGAAYAIITFLSRAITACVTCVSTERPGATHTVFGRYEWHQPEPIVLTDEEYKRMNQAANRAIERFFKRGGKILNGGSKLRGVALKVAALFVGCLCCMEKEDRRDIKARIREKALEEGTAIEEMQEWAVKMDQRVSGALPGQAV